MTRKLMARLSTEMDWLRNNGIGVTIFAGNYGAGGAIAYISTVNREDMVKSIREWADKAEIYPTDPRGETGRG